MKRVSFQMVVDGSTLAAAVLFTLVMGLLGGLLPALSAMRLKPLDSLR
jgi:ABC-type antimicrobial peptide transport system permease subunit